MSAYDTLEKTCNEHGTPLQIYRPEDAIGCPDCREAWREETLDDWPDADTMPIPDLDYSKYFGSGN